MKNVLKNEQAPVMRAATRIAAGLVLLVSIGLTACGGSHRAADNGASGEAAKISGRDTNQFSAKDLQLKILRAGDDPALPSDKAPADWIANLNKDAVVGLNHLDYSDNIPLPPDLNQPYANLFFVFPDDSLVPAGLGKTKSAQYELRMFHMDNRLGGSTNQTVVSYDGDRGRFFIPFSELFPEKEYDVDTRDRFRLKIHLSTEKGEATFEVHFQVIGNTPRTEARNMEIPKSDIWTIEHQVGRGDWPIQRTSFTNPTHRRLKLYLRDAETQLRLSALLQFLYYGEESRPDGVLKNYYSDAQLTFKGFRYWNETEHFEEARNNRWIAITLEPLQTVQVDQIVDSASPGCSLPGTGYYWINGRKTKRDVWSIPALFQFGTHHWEARLAEEWVKPEAVAGFEPGSPIAGRGVALVHSAADDSPGIEWGIGDTSLRGNLGPTLCQGTF